MKPGNNEDSQEEGDDVDVGVDDVREGVPVNISDKVKDPGFVEDGVDFRNKENHGKPLNHLSLPGWK